MKKIRTFVGIAACLAVVSAALAHGNEDHAAKPGGKATAHEHSHEGAAIGEPGNAARVDRTIQVGMSDAMRFLPSSISVRQGETIRFVIHNEGQLRHEMVLGTQHELKEHYELMKKFPEMEHADAEAVTVAPGKTGEILWRFTKVGNVNFACLESGHYDAGMKGMVKVSAVKGAARKQESRSSKKP